MNIDDEYDESMSQPSINILHRISDTNGIRLNSLSRKITEETKAPPLFIILISMFQVPESDKTKIAISFSKSCMQASSSSYHSFQTCVSPFKAFSISAMI